MDGLEFLTEPPVRAATLVIQPHNSQERSIHNLDMDVFERWCPSLADRFHSQKDSSLKICVLKGTSITAAICFLRYLYLGEYTFYQANVDVLVPPLLHLQVFFLAERWDLPDLQILVLTHLTEDTDPTWGQGYHPMDLCEAIRYLYVELASHTDPRKILADYCVANFVNDGLQTHEYFRQTVYECPPFLKDLCRANMDNGFSDPSAFTIMSLPVCKHFSHSSRTLNPAALNFNCAFHEGEEDPAVLAQPDTYDDEGDDCKTVIELEADDSATDLPSTSVCSSPRTSEASTDSHGFTIIPIRDFEWTMLEEGSSSAQHPEESSSELSDSEFELVVR